MRSTYGEALRLTIYGQSHGPHIGIILEGIPAGLAVDQEALQVLLDRRAPGRNELSSTRSEADIPHFLSGITAGYTNGQPIEAIIRNLDVRSGDYDQHRECPRPGHADYTAIVKYGNNTNIDGGGHFSGRMTAPLCIAGGLCIQWLRNMGIQIGAHISQIADVKDSHFNPIQPELHDVSPTFPVLNAQQGAIMQERILTAKANGDSLGGIIECAAVGLPVGWGGPMFAGIESRVAQIVYGIPAVKGVEFGSGFHTAELRGSENNDAFALCDGKVVTLTNNCGGILGGITNGMPLVFRVAIKPTPSIALPQKSVNLVNMCESTITITGRHDPCIVPRAVPVIEAAAAIALFDAYLVQEDSHGTV